MGELQSNCSTQDAVAWLENRESTDAAINLEARGEICANAAVSLICCCRWQKLELQLLDSRKVGGVLCGRAMIKQLGQDDSPLRR